MHNQDRFFPRGRCPSGRVVLLEPLESRQHFSAVAKAFDTPTPRAPADSSTAPVTIADTGFFDGVQMNYTPEPSTTIPLLRDLGAKGVRLWGQLSHWSDRSDILAFQRAREYHNAGFKVNVLIQCSEVPTYATAKAFFDWAQSIPGMKAGVDRWEIVNEVNLSSYWAGTLTSYVTNVLKAAWDSLHPAGETIVGASTAADTNSCITLKNAGYLNYCDLTNIHPYTTTVATQQSMINTTKSIYAGKPLTITEWNFHPTASNQTPSIWSGMLDQEHPFIAANTESAFYYRFFYQTTSQSGPAGLVYDDLTQHQPFYGMFKSWHPSPKPPLASPTLDTSGWSIPSSTTTTSGIALSTSSSDDLNGLVI